MRIIRVSLLLICVLMLFACGGQTSAPVSETTAAPAVSEAPITPQEDIISAPTATPDPTPVPTPTPTPAPTPTPTPEPTPTPVPTPELITNERLDSGEFDGYFDGVLLAGDSLTNIFSHYVRDVRNEGNKEFLGGMKFLASTSMSTKRASEDFIRKDGVNFSYRGKSVTLTDGIRQIGAKKVFLMFGLNDLCVRNWDDVLAYYGKIIDQIREKCPETEIVVQGVLPVRKVFYNREPAWNDYNIGLKALCEEKEVEYVSFAEELMDEDGFLRADLCGDGKCHLSIAGEKIWVRFLRRYAASHTLENIVFETP